jgi:hypothetical protein
MVKFPSRDPSPIIPLEESTCHLRGGTSLPLKLERLSPPLANYPAEIKSSQQWQAKIHRLEDREETERKTKQGRRNGGDNGTERRVSGANCRGAWELWQEGGGMTVLRKTTMGIWVGLLAQVGFWVSKWVAGSR